MRSRKILSKGELVEIKKNCSVKDFISILCISFWSILSMLDKKEIDLYLEHSRLEIFLCTEITLVIFKLSEKVHAAKNILKIHEKCSSILFLSDFNNSLEYYMALLIFLI